MLTPSRPAASPGKERLSVVTAGCLTGVKVHLAIAEPFLFPEVLGRLFSCRKCACLLPGPLTVPSQFPSASFPKENGIGFEQEAYFSDIPRQGLGGAQNTMC